MPVWNSADGLWTLDYFVKNKKNKVTSSFGRTIPNTMSKLKWQKLNIFGKGFKN